jgi:hypothetical protein
MKHVMVAMPGNEPFADALATEAGLERMPVTVRRFPG